MAVVKSSLSLDKITLTALPYLQPASTERIEERGVVNWSK
jgi:hypothetical protein